MAALEDGFIRRSVRHELTVHREDDSVNVIVTLATLQAQNWNQFGTLLDATALSSAAAQQLRRGRGDIPRLAGIVTELLNSAASTNVLGSITVDRASVTKFRQEEARAPLAVRKEIGSLVNREGTVLVHNMG